MVGLCRARGGCGAGGGWGLCQLIFLVAEPAGVYHGCAERLLFQCRFKLGRKLGWGGFNVMAGNKIRILTSGALTTFADTVYANKARLRRIWILSPWISGSTPKGDAIAYLVEALQKSECLVSVITRKPTADWHYQALRIMWENFRPTLYYCPTLHSKLYLAECDGFRCAMFGSPNLTAKADNENRELAIEFRTTVESREDDVAAIISRLAEYAKDLASEDDVTLIDEP
jgi:hypothetical protein